MGLISAALARAGRLGCAAFIATASLTLTALAPPAGATAISFTPDPTSSFSFAANASNGPSVGYIYKLGLNQGAGGPLSLTPDLSLAVPLSSTKASVVAVLSRVYWAGGAADPLQFTGFVSTANRLALQGLLARGLTSTAASIGFGVFDFDPITSQYYFALGNSAATTGGTVPAVVAVISGKPQLTVSSTPSFFSGGGNVYQFTISVAPPPSVQYLTFAVGPSQKLTKQWGIALAGVLSCVEPKLVGLTEGQARHGLAKADCAVAVRKIHSTKKHRGRVIRASGTAGKTYAAGHKVTVYIGS